MSAGEGVGARDKEGVTARGREGVVARPIGVVARDGLEGVGAREIVSTRNPDIVTLLWPLADPGFSRFFPGLCADSGLGNGDVPPALPAAVPTFCANIGVDNARRTVCFGTGNIDGFSAP